MEDVRIAVFVGTYIELEKNIRSVGTALHDPKACKVCCGDTCSTCYICRVYLHFIPSKGNHNIGKMCFSTITMIIFLDWLEMMEIF